MLRSPTAVRRLFVPVSALLLAAWALVCWGPSAFAQTNTQRQPTLRERLVAGLQVRRPSEQEYINAVIDTVNRGELPEKVVNRMFFWARSRAPKGNGKDRPIIYFQPGLNRVAAKLRIEIKHDPDPTPVPTTT